MKRMRFMLKFKCNLIAVASWVVKDLVFSSVYNIKFISCWKGSSTGLTATFFVVQNKIPSWLLKGNRLVICMTKNNWNIPLSLSLQSILIFPKSVFLTTKTSDDANATKKNKAINNESRCGYIFSQRRRGWVSCLDTRKLL